MKSIETDGVLVCYPTGRIDSTNAAAFEQELTQALAAGDWFLAGFKPSSKFSVKNK